MALKDIHERLYGREQLHKEDQQHTSGFRADAAMRVEGKAVRPQPEGNTEATSGPRRYKRDWKENEEMRKKQKEQAARLKGTTMKRSTMVLIGVAVLIVLGGASVLAYYYIFREKDTFDPNDIKLSIVAPDSLASGDDVTFTVKLENGSDVVLQGASLRFQKPDGFTALVDEASSSPFEVRDLEPFMAGEVRSVEFRGRLIGERNSIKTARATLSYSPENFPESTFEVLSEFDVTISSVPISLSGSAQQEVASGGTVVWTVSYLNNSNAVYEDAVLEVTYPDGFTFLEAKPEPSSRQGVWELGNFVKTSEPQQIEIRGTLSGNQGESKVFTARIFSTIGGQRVVYSEDKTVITIAKAPFSLLQTVNGQSGAVADLDEELEYEVAYKNTTDITLSRVIVTLSLVSDALDLSTLDVEDGSFDGTTRMIIWDASGISTLASLAPGEGGSVRFSVKTLDRLRIEAPEHKNFVVKTVATIDSPDVPQPLGENKIVTSNELSVKVNTRVDVFVRGYYLDPSGVSNSGPIPPRVGEKTTYSVHWQVFNVNNDMKDVVVRGVLPTGVRYEGQVGVTAGKDLKYDERTGELVWTIGNVAAHTGVRLPVLEAVFQVSIVPAENQVGQTIPLTAADTGAMITGVDLFTEKEREDQAEALTTDLPDDPSIGQFGATVVKAGG